MHHGTVPAQGAPLAAAMGRDVLVDSTRVRDPVLEEIVLAHELAHVAQQTKGATTGAFHRNESAVETNADGVAVALFLGRPAVPVAAPLRLARCVGPARPTGSAITPAHFEFQTVVPIRAGSRS